MLPELAGEFLARMADGHKIESVEVNVDDAGEFTYQFGTPAQPLASNSKEPPQMAELTPVLAP